MTEYLLNGIRIEKMANKLSKANHSAIRQCECERIAAENKRLREERDEVFLCGWEAGWDACRENQIMGIEPDPEAENRAFLKES